MLERSARRYVVFSLAKAPDGLELFVPNIASPAGPVFGFTVTWRLSTVLVGPEISLGQFEAVDELLWGQTIK